MKLNDLISCGYAIEILSNRLNIPPKDIINALEGLCWSEEDGGELLESIEFDD